MGVCVCVCERAFLLYCVSLGSPPRIAVLTAGFDDCENKVNVVVVILVGISSQVLVMANPNVCLP